ncbi:uncharacterized protein BDZ99DRAFT_122826 [Mytilinidion resinicola]|uniref:Uncharacterized protein n=1 Tax=Mytilinidion resinicola TaxID=574789 RepID=A0A6A6Z452_9PEZI|nr:uncharacterized protein BDZ99DRAFT_122826 [Mytilinidion resinicola]KAF2815810.1 hypothetical protein BDZ99DRAFT_122826 [Mytilinidion resinicola]
MPSTTLVTFLFESAPAARTIELLGSWDNFNKPYAMKLDLRKGKNFWSGCYSFEDIICDGDLSSPGLRRNGALKMGGTYWYYYRVDGHNECHDPSQPSTTLCPLLPGQPLNVLEVPYDSRSRSNSASSTSSGVHTLNPEDKYLNPRPAPLPLPKIITSSHGLAEHRKRPHLDMKYLASNDGDYPRSAGYDSPSRARSRSPFRRLAKSAAGSPSESLKTTLFDFKEASDKIKATFERVNFGKSTLFEEQRGRSRHARGTHELQIGSPVLISGLDERRELIPFSTGVSEIPFTLPVAPNAQSANFSPLRSHPVGPSDDLRFPHLVEENPPPPKRACSQAQDSSLVPGERTPLRGRALSAEHRRSKSPRQVRESREGAEVLYRRRSMSVGKVREPSPLRNTVVYDELLLIPDQIQEAKNEDDNNMQTPGAMWTTFLATPPSNDSRPPSRRGEEPEPFLRSMPLVGKELPNLPSYLVPEPLFFHNRNVDGCDDSRDFAEAGACEEPTSHFSLWSTTSIEFPALSSDGDGVHSPTLSSITTSSSDIETPQRLSGQYMGDLNALYETASLNDESPKSGHSSPVGHGTRVAHDPAFRNSTTLGTSFNFHIARPESASRRHATCFALADGFQGYSLPDYQTASEATLTKASTPLTAFADSSTPRVEQSLRSDATMTQLEQLMTDFGYLGGAVL